MRALRTLAGHPTDEERRRAAGSAGPRVTVIASVRRRGWRPDRHGLAGSQDPDVGFGRNLSHERGEAIPGLEEWPPPHAMEVAGIEGSPVDGNHGRGPDVAGDLGCRARSQVARSKVRSPAPDGKQRKVHAAGHVDHGWETAGIASEIDARPGPEHVANRLGPRSPGRDPVPSWDGTQGDAVNFKGLTVADLHDLAGRVRATRLHTEPKRHDERRPAWQPFDRPSIEMVGMAVGDDDNVGLELRGRWNGTVALEWAKARAEEWVRQDADATHLDQGRRVADEPHVDRSRPRRVRVSPADARWGHPTGRGSGATAPGGGAT